jgi:pyruvate,water dikinase
MVRNREATKSRLVLATARFKAAYRQLGRALASRRRLEDEDLVFFLTHVELGVVSRGRSPELARIAAARRDALPFQMGLVFDEVVRGRPEPHEAEPPVDTAGTLVGQPVSRGVVSGFARVVRTLEEASEIRRGEILVAPITDVGWTPYFAAIAGLATDIGSAVSHGAVVAREYGLPAVVNLRHATRRFKTGDRVLLDGERGVLRLLGDDE